jgi:hypothetical protein
MMVRRLYQFTVLVGLLLIVSACGTQPQLSQESDLWTQQQFGSYVQQMGNNVKLTAQGQQNEALAALGAIPANAPISNLSALANPNALSNPSTSASLMQGLSVAGLRNVSELAPANNSGAIKLPRGTWTSDGQTWSYQAGSKDLILKFPFGNLDGTISNVTVQVIWDEYSKTVEVTDGTARYEVPTGLRIRSYTDGSKSGFIDIFATWYKSTCGTTLLEPSKLAIKGEFGYQGAINVQFEVNVKKTQKGENNLQAAYFGNNTAIESDGFVKVLVGKDSGKVFWNNIGYATVKRASNCVLTDFRLDRGEIDFGATFTVAGKTDTAQLRFEFSNIVTTNDLATSSVDLDGKIKVNGQVVVLFEGTLEATGQKLKLTFADGSMSLAEFIQIYLGNVSIDFGSIPLPTLPTLP